MASKIVRSGSNGSQINGLISNQLRHTSDGQRSRSLSPTKESTGKHSSSHSDASRQSSADLNFAFDEASTSKDRGLSTAPQSNLLTAPSGQMNGRSHNAASNSQKRVRFPHNGRPEAVAHGIVFFLPAQNRTCLELLPCIICAEECLLGI